MVRRLDQDVARIGERKHAAVAERRGKVRGDVDVGAGHEAQRQAFAVQCRLQVGGCLPDLRAAVMVDPGQDVRGAGDHGDAVVEESARHRQRHRQIGGAVVDAGQDVAMQVDHHAAPQRSGLNRPGFAGGSNS
jgi:hypothetical protein